MFSLLYSRHILSFCSRALPGINGFPYLTMRKTQAFYGKFGGSLDVIGLGRKRQIAFTLLIKPDDGERGYEVDDVELLCSISER